MKLFEIFDKSYIDSILWQDHRDGYWGVFDLEGLRFTIDVKYETLAEMEKNYNLKQYNVEHLLQDRKIIRIDFNQILDGEYRQDNTENAGDLSLKILATVAVESAKKLKDKEVNVIYFAAKPHDDKSKNVRQTLYPRLGQMMGRRLNMMCLVDKDGDQTLTILLKGYSVEEFTEFKMKLNGKQS